MTPSPIPASAPAAGPRPVDAHERLLLLDALRGFALCGVFVSNIMMWFSGRVLLPRAQLEAFMKNASFPDLAAQYVFGFLIFGKFITLFSFLFGLGFAVQMGRAEARGTSIVPLYARRLAVLLAIGLLHLCLLWYGDILSTYALLGFGLLLFRSRSNRTVLLWAAGFILVTPILAMLLLRLPQLLASSPEAAAALAKAAGERSAELKAQTLHAFTSGGYLDVVRAGLRFFVDIARGMTTVLLALLGRFLLGLLAGRHRLLHDVPRHLRLLRRLLGWGLVAGVLGSGAVLLVQHLRLHGVLQPGGPRWLPFVMVVMQQLGEVGLASVYLASFSLLFQRARWRRLLGLLAPAGRMALTNYLTQTLIGLGLFYGYGLGLIGKLGPAQCLALALATFGVQVAWSHLWLSYFRFGPAEWLWRSLTYGKLQPMRHLPAMAGRAAEAT